MTPAEALKIVREYGAAMEARSALGTVRDVTSLSCSKEKVKQALLVALKATNDSTMREHLRVGYVSLAQFQELTAAQIKSLQLWNNSLARKTNDMTLDDLREEARTMSAASGDAIEIQKRCADEAEELMSELRGAGF